MFALIRLKIESQKANPRVTIKMTECPDGQFRFQDPRVCPQVQAVGPRFPFHTLGGGSNNLFFNTL